MNYNNAVREIFEKIIEIKKSRQNAYGELWSIIPTDILFDVAIYKIFRAKHCNTDKRFDDILDAVNFLIFAYARLKS